MVEEAAIGAMVDVPCFSYHEKVASMMDQTTDKESLKSNQENGSLLRMTVAWLDGSGFTLGGIEDVSLVVGSLL
jgi:hypothetical protein